MKILKKPIMEPIKISLVTGLLFLSGSIFAQTKEHHEMMKDSTSHENHKNTEMHDMEQMYHPKGVPMCNFWDRFVKL